MKKSKLKYAAVALVMLCTANLSSTTVNAAYRERVKTSWVHIEQQEFGSGKINKWNESIQYKDLTFKNNYTYTEQVKNIKTVSDYLLGVLVKDKYTRTYKVY